MTNSLLQTLNSRLDVAKRFTEDNQKDIKNWISLYEAETPKAKSIEELVERDQRYQYTAKVVFDNVEKYRSSFFETVPDVMYSKKGKMDEEKAEKITASWEYLKEKVNFKQFMDDSYTYFGLCGFVSGHVGYKKEYETAVDDEGVEYVKWRYDDPIIEVFDYEDEWFMPDSKFSPDARDVSFFRKKKMTKAEAYKAFNVELETDESILSEDIDTEKEKMKGELARCGIYYYTGTLPKGELVEYLKSKMENGELEGMEDSDGDNDGSKENEDESGEDKDKSERVDEESESDELFLAVFTKSKILEINKAPIGEPTIALGRWYSLPKKFFGFGLGRQLEEQQRQESIRTGQLVRYADLLAFPKMAIDLTDAGTDPKQLMDRKSTVITYRKNKPEYINPPSSNGAIQAMQGQNQQDIQTNSGVADLSKMQQSRTMETATGQTQVSESNEKRIKTAKDKYYEFLKQIIIKTFKYAQAEWQEEKIQTITDDDGNTTDVTLTAEDFADINFDTDISVDFETVGVNKDVKRQQNIVMYDKIKDDPIVNREKIFKKMIKEGFGEKNPDQFIRETDIQPGMKFTSEDGQQYVADETGTIVLQEAMNELAPGSDGNMQPASNESAVLGNALDVGL